MGVGCHTCCGKNRDASQTISLPTDSLGPFNLRNRYLPYVANLELRQLMLWILLLEKANGLEPYTQKQLSEIPNTVHPLIVLTEVYFRAFGHVSSQTLTTWKYVS